MSRYRRGTASIPQVRRCQRDLWALSMHGGNLGNRRDNWNALSSRRSGLATRQLASMCLRLCNVLPSLGLALRCRCWCTRNGGIDWWNCMTQEVGHVSRVLFLIGRRRWNPIVCVTFMRMFGSTISPAILDIASRRLRMEATVDSSSRRCPPQGIARSWAGMRVRRVQRLLFLDGRLLDIVVLIDCCWRINPPDRKTSYPTGQERVIIIHRRRRRG